MYRLQSCQIRKLESCPLARICASVSMCSKLFSCRTISCACFRRTHAQSNVQKRAGVTVAHRKGAQMQHKVHWINENQRESGHCSDPYSLLRAHSLTHKLNEVCPISEPKLHQTRPNRIIISLPLPLPSPLLLRANLHTASHPSDEHNGLARPTRAPLLCAHLAETRTALPSYAHIVRVYEVYD